MREKLKHAYQTERLVLAPVTIDDAPDMFEYASNPENAYYVFETNKTLEDTKDIIRKIFIENGLGKYGIFLNEKLIGTIYFLNLDDRNKSAELSYVLNEKFEGHGYATEAAIKLRDIFFNELEGERLYARHTFDNLKSMNLMARIGMKIEGTLRKSYCFHGRQVDLAIWSITRDDL
ncbi:N-acetyltransferase [Lacticaseibacillus rhamnosus]|uniref:GNAT family N-acetyltransferase n=1 Tax=Lacticaseibacillus rhamnosus TaxID=47715 RepID=UPI0007E1D756|nr:GNAT family N-acetyltransferase [Lacticaseibacillus rhamnosus]MCZ2732016.1 GNAT family N-acetyltransferase [Lacticaseibacillus rhamnosus]MCZ2734809.1 GNAT family N-acetyltransferase [Lacticaseibacillus rhamnosus]MCZ2741175.1 GNAT family N-acetyltransferase [Lacticaseibacillus rhamnosus]MCZ2743775.1 GNAT family N-acetyltransferase [Lacticaseibacillus rhamnosus]MCZ2746369.1 GNAT family N-acetyltransferase [Lacticaseibacillus rhamnosus]